MATERAVSGYPAVQDYLFGLKAGGMKFGIDRMRILSEMLGRPEGAVPCVHVAGTNGKGSVSAMIESILRASGLRTGLYTSPHLVRLGERVQVDRVILSEAEIMDYVGVLRPLTDAIVAKWGEEDRPSFFEFMTAMAFMQFQKEKCDVSVIEVGLGGRLDATNVVKPEVSVITSISLDHVEMLGNSLEAIAGEKAGIIKEGRPLVMGRVPREAEAIIRNVAASMGSRVISVREEFGEDAKGYPATNLEGDYQRWNAATARLTADLLGPRFRISKDAIEKGLANVDWTGRWQRTHLGGRLTFFDASHNPEGAGVLAVNLASLRKETGKKIVAVVAAMGAMRAKALLQVLASQCSEIHFVVPKQSRACSYDEMEALIPRDYEGKTVRSTVGGLFPSPGVCTAGGPDDVLVITGSIYLLGEVLANLEPQRGPSEGRLQDF